MTEPARTHSTETAADARGGILRFGSDYMEGAHPEVLQRLVETNFEQSPGYGTDARSKHAADLIREACENPSAEVVFLSGGTQANATIIDCLLMPWQGVIAPTTGHIAVHEAGIIERDGHKVLTVPAVDGKIDAAGIEAVASQWNEDANRDHMVMPGLVYLSQPTECGTLYSRAELEAISEVAHGYGMNLFIDGARLAYALAAPDNDATLADLARLADAFTLGGTKCGALFGEAVVLREAGLVPHLTARIKQHGALFAKGRILGAQYEALFEDRLYERIGAPAIEAATRIRATLDELGFEQAIPSTTNQTFIVLDRDRATEFGREVEYGFWENLPDGRVVIRIATCWATREAEVDALLEVLRRA